VYAPVATTVQVDVGFSEVISNNLVRPTLFVGLGELITTMGFIFGHLFSVA